MSMKSNYCAKVLVASAVIFTSLSLQASAQNRPDTRRMYCEEASSFVKAHGAVVMSTGRFTYERMVRNRSYCQADEDIRRVLAPTRDDRRCFVGYRCIPRFIIQR